MNFNVIREKEESYILNEQNEKIAYVLYPIAHDETHNILTTFVDDSLRGMGVAKILLDDTYQSIKEQEHKTLVTCSYAIHYFEKNIEKQDILKAKL